jgi:thiol:disulfide interchange protein
MQKQVITHFETKELFYNCLEKNPGIFILKIGAAWCRPCKTIKPVVDAVFASSPDTVLCADIDIVENVNQEIYLILKKRLRLQGIPCLLMYKQGNTDIVPDEMITGSEPNKLHIFFQKCGKHLADVMKAPSITNLKVES